MPILAVVEDTVTFVSAYGFVREQVPLIDSPRLADLIRNIYPPLIGN